MRLTINTNITVHEKAMRHLLPNTRYMLLYKNGETVEFHTLDEVPEAKLLIRVRECKTQHEVELISLLRQPWLDVIPVGNENHDGRT